MIKYFLYLLSLLFLFASTTAFGSVSHDFLLKNFSGDNYVPTRQNCYLADGSPVTELRQFEMTSQDEHREYSLVVNNESLETSIEPSDSLYNCTPESLTPDYIFSSNYYKALSKMGKESSPLRNAGTTHEVNKRQSIYLTVDLCPSHKPLDIELFQKIQGGVRPVPVVISISGYWLLQHASDFSKLLEMQQAGDLDITWVNHTYTHPYDPKLPFNHNFLLMQQVNLVSEVFENEKLLLKNGIIPSIFFRFPGLISNQTDIEQLQRWGLIPLGADAWLALGEKPTFGSFILVHGNGNEPVGLKILYRDLENNPDMKKYFSDIKQAFQD